MGALRCDIFCRVVDNFGDIGVAWRLARQLTHEYGCIVRLFVDDVPAAHRLVPAIDPQKPWQTVESIELIRWAGDDAEYDGANLVIEAFGCGLPQGYLRGMSATGVTPVWVNLEYLTAEAWVESHHLLCSPHPSLPLTTHFFFPGFTPKTGGILREQSLAIPTPKRRDESLSIFYFAYPHAPLDALCNAPLAEGRRIELKAFLSGNDEKLKHQRASQAKSALKCPPMLEFSLCAFVPQAELDRVLAECDVLFVRGEDSFVRAQLAGRPFIWHIYPQAEGAHLVKLNAFLDRYCTGLSPEAATALRGLWLAWNGAGGVALDVAWKDFLAHLDTLSLHAIQWAAALHAQPPLAANLLSFYKKIVKI